MIDPSDNATDAADPDATNAQPSHAAAQMIGPYRLLQRIGEGGMGEVWLAEQTRPVRRQVALKIIKAGMDTAQVVARFEAERQALALMAHPGIAQVFDAGATPQGRPYFAMEYVHGEAITTYCNRQRLSTQARLELFLQVCDAVQHAHQKGVIHRDLKPSNILVTLLDNRPTPKIIDFGVAKAIVQHLTERTLFTELGVLIGTPEYMSPEQAEMTGLDIDTRTDVYALGVTLYELLTGALPFDSQMLREKGLDEIRRIIRETDPPRPSTRVTLLGATAATVAKERHTDPVRLASQLRGDLDWITMRTLEKDRTRRYGSVSDLATDLQRHLDHVPVLAGPPSTTYRVGKFVRRHRFGVAVSTAALGLLVAFAVTMASQTRRITRERDRAEHVSAFLVGLFEAADPDKAKGDKVTARELLDRGVERLKVELKDEPETRASLLTSIGRVYIQLGRFDRAQSTLEEALVLRRTFPGRGRLDLAATLNELAKVSDGETAERAVREVLEIRRTTLGPDHVDVGKAMNNLANRSFGRGRWKEAEDLYRQAASIMKRAGAPANIAVVPSIGLGTVLLREGKYSAAIDVLRDGVDVTTRGLGRKHSFTLAAMNDLGQALSQAGQVAEAEHVQREVLDTRRTLLGDGHRFVASARFNLGNTLGELGRFDEAAQMLGESVAVYRANFRGPDDQMAWALTDLGSVEYERGHLDEAERLHREAAAMFQQIDANSTNIGKPWYGIAEVLYRRGQRAEAEQYFQMNLDLLKKSPNAAPTILAWPETAVGRLLTERGRPDDAEPLLRRALASLRADLPAEHWRTGYADVLLGACLASRHQFDEAEPPLLSGYRVLHEKRGDDREETRYAVTRLVMLYEGWNKPDRAAEWRAKVPNDRRDER